MNTRSHLGRRLRIVPPFLLGIAALAVVVVSSYWSPPVAGGVAGEQSFDAAARQWTEQVFVSPKPDGLGGESEPTPTPTPVESRAAKQQPAPQTQAEPPASLPGLAPAPASGQPSAAGPTPTAVPPTSTPAPSCPIAGMGGFAAALYNAVNEARAANGMAALAADGCVTYVAQLRSQDMASNSYFSHTSPGGQTAFSLLDAYGVPYAWAGENLARNNYPDEETVAIAIRDLMASEGHRANILHSHYTRLGVGFAEDGAGVRYFTMIFTGS